MGINTKIKCRLSGKLYNTGKKAVIVTFYHNKNNYGGVLQAYALAYIVKNRFCECDVLKVKMVKRGIADKFGEIYRKYGLPATIVRTISFLIRKVKRFLGKPLDKSIEKDMNIRKSNFENFREAKIDSTKTVYDEGNIADAVGDYDIFICGSDQIWKLGLQNESESIYWLEFVPSDKPKISYAASMSQDSITEAQQKRVRKYLSDFTAISVREKRGKELLDLALKGSKEVHWVLDPTLLLGSAEWDKLCSPRITEEKYIFAYILGESRYQRRFVKSFAKKRKLKIVTLPHILGNFRFCDAKFGDIKLYDVSPEDFISLIKHAEYVFTDSFHCAAFSGIYHKEFFIFKRNKDSHKGSINSRIYSLMEIFGTQDRIIDERADSSNIGKSEPIDYFILEKNIAKERGYSLNFLTSALAGDSN